MQLGIFAKTFVGTSPQQVLSAAADAGYATVQYNMACSGLDAMPDVISDDQTKAIAQATQNTKISIAAVSGTYNMIHPDLRIRAKGMARLETLGASCSVMGTGMITLCTGTCDADDQWRHHPDNSSDASWADLLGEMEKAIAIAERYDLALGIEPELANVVSSAAKANTLIYTLKSSRLRVILDAANLFKVASLVEQHDVIDEAVDLLVESLAMAHAKDRSATGAFVAAGKGVLDYGYYISALKRCGFQGPIIAHGLTAAEAPHVALFLNDMLQQVGN